MSKWQAHSLEHVAGIDGLIPCWWVAAVKSDPDISRATAVLRAFLNGDSRDADPWHPLVNGELYGFQARRAWLDLDLSGKNALIVAVLQVASAIECTFRQSFLSGYRVWVNGAPVLDLWDREEPNLDQGSCTLSLTEGENVIAVEVPAETFSSRGIFAGRLETSDKMALHHVRAIGIENAANTGDPERATHPEYSPFSIFKARTRRPHTLRFAPETGQGVDEWRRLFDYEFRRLFGPWPPRVALDPQVTHTKAIESVTCERILIRTDPDAVVPIYLYLPTHPNGKSLLVLHGHQERLGAPGAFRPPKGGDSALELANRGFVTVVPVFREFGERHEELPISRRDPCDVDFYRHLLYGETSLMYQLNDAIRTVDYLLTRKEVDPDHVGVTGLSYGGRTAMYLAALDDRLKGCVSSGAMNLFKERLAIGSSCGGQFLPGLLSYGDTTEMFGLIAPRPLLLQLGTNDGSSPEIYAAEIDKGLRAIYHAYGCGDRYATDVFHSGHVYRIDTAVRWFHKWL